MITVTVCVGSSCHIKGARELIARFNEFLSKKGLEDKVELKGSFCMEHCGEGINWKINDEILTSSDVEGGVKMLGKKLRLALKQGKTKRPAKRAVRRRKKA
ncbi:MAG: (2Fe-2S) ferredoxin domain-containing protein [Planctomycetota bacterium]|nr:MAG: (2Fe-2S) ferredoxin domain-containing protein [Planctomycetota bacterium]